MTKLTELEKQKVIACVNYLIKKFEYDRYKLEIAYDKLEHSDEEYDKALEHVKEMGEFYSNLSKKLIAQEAINQYNEVKSVIEKNKGKTIEEVYEICFDKFYGNVFNFDGELFDIELDRIEATIKEVNGTPTLLERFDVDISENLIGDWSLTGTVEELQEIISSKEV